MRIGVSSGIRPFDHVDRSGQRFGPIPDLRGDVLRSGQDVPVVEDFPLAPEEETPDFQHLANTLQFRLLRALEHWKGNTHLTLTAIIVRTVNAGLQAGSGSSKENGSA
jgi:hypothetical protein